MTCVTYRSGYGEAAINPPCAEPDYTTSQSLDPLLLILHTHTDTHTWTAIMMSVKLCHTFLHSVDKHQYSEAFQHVTSLSGLCGFISSTTCPLRTRMTWESPSQATYSVRPRRKVTTPVVPQRRCWGCIWNKYSWSRGRESYVTVRGVRGRSNMLYLPLAWPFSQSPRR